MNWDRRIYDEDPLKTMGIKIVVVVIVSAAAAIGFGLEPIWPWVAFGAGGAFLITLPFTLWQMF